jgi:diaminohydroxyphosphoribosylaminopyrimidine deaminase/5-amino-6-(5-phosphoribosylamino)uracil reductase
MDYKNKDIFTTEDRKYMKMAIKLAEKARGSAGPNPMVGAVIVKNGSIISTGYHKIAGQPHAEIEAINNSCGVNLKGSTMYVTLEPCTVYCKTPPCVDEIIKHKFGEIVIGCIDPNPEVNGNGVRALRKAGLIVKEGLMADKISTQNEVFFKHIKTKIPFICCKIASSIDGKMAAKTSDSKWITSEKSRKTVHKLRREYNCILTGINTILADDPLLFPRKISNSDKNSKKLNIYSFLDKNHKFYRVILDSDLQLKLNSNIVKTSRQIKTIVFTDSKADIMNNNKINKLKNSSIDIIKIDVQKEASDKIKKLNLKKILKILYKKYNITSVLLETGPTLITSFLQSNLIDKFIIFFSPKIIGGDSRYDIFSKLNIKKIQDAIKIKFDNVKRIGDDIVITAYPIK